MSGAEAGEVVVNGAATLGLLLDAADRRRDHERSVNHYGRYAVEVLEHAGLSFRSLQRGDLLADSLPSLVVLPYRVRLAGDEVAALTRHVDGGGAVIAFGGVEQADALFGVTSTRREVGEGVLTWPAGALGLEAGRSPVWGGQLLPTGTVATGATALGEVRLADGTSGAGIVIAPRGAGVTCLVAPDVLRSVVTMQQGSPVLGDGVSAPDGSAGIEDRVLKTDDGVVIDWSLREPGPEGPAYLTPYADLLRELMLAALCECAERTGRVLAMRWYWPGRLPAVAALSYDTDSNEDPDGRAFLAHVAKIGVNGTWCVMYPGGYEPSTYAAIRAYGDEIALHYDGLTTDLNGAPHCGWSQEDFDHQLAWLRAETSLDDVISQKNHVTRWEGWLELFRWVEGAGVRVDQTKGPSKIGNLGFAFGTCHPWRPLEDALHDNRLMDVYELGFHTHDMHHNAARVELRRRLLDAAVARAGVAHFIFHPQRIHEEGQPAAIADIVDYGRELGVEWWQSERIWRWETARRGATVEAEASQGTVRLRTEQAPPGLTVLLFGLPGAASGVAGGVDLDRLRSAGVDIDQVTVLGRSAYRLVVPEGASEVALHLSGSLSS